jgi:mRNA interferase RelE/StbE
MYNIVFTNRSIKDLENLSPEVKTRIITKLKEYLPNPFDYCTKLSDIKLGTYRFRIGEYRVIFDLDGTTLIILRIGHRKEIYK